MSHRPSSPPPRPRAFTPAAKARLKQLTDAKVAVETIDNVSVIVAGRFEFFPASSLWKGRDGQGKRIQGYDVGELIKLAKARPEGKTA